MMAFFIKLKVTGNLKTFIKIMISLNFHDVEDDTVLSIHVNDSEHSLIIYLESEYEEISWGIRMDKSTAIKFSKELRKKIDLIN